MGLRDLKHEIKDLQRLREIISVLAEQGFHTYLERAHLLHHAKLTSRVTTEPGGHDPEKVREALEKLGPTFVKLGQLLSIRPDLVPPEYCAELRKLQDDAAPVSPTIIKKRIEAELKQPITQVFKNFQDTPLAAASISQVHKAQLKDGTPVVLKVQRPDVREEMAVDVDLMEHIAERLDKRFASLRASEIVEEFKIYSKRELDFLFEARNVRKFHNYFEEDPEIIIPKVYEEYSTMNLLVLEEIKGTKVSDKKALRAAKFSLPKLARIGFRSAFQQVFDLGIFHADPHPGNLLAKKTNGHEQLVVLDFGIVGYLDREMQDLFIRFFIGMVNGDAEDVTDVIMRLGHAGPNADPRELKQTISTLLLDWRGTTMEEQKVSTLFHRIVRASVDQDIKLPADVVLVAKAFLTVEGVAIWLDPKFNLTEESAPLIKQLKEKRLHRFANTAMRDAVKSYDVLRQLPKSAARALDRLGSGKVNVNIDQTIFHKAAVDYDLESSKRNIAMMSAAFFIGSSVLALAKPEVRLLNIPLYLWGFGIFIISLLLLMIVSIKMARYLTREL